MKSTFNLTKGEDPANIYKLQKSFWKCLSARTAAISAYLYQSLQNAKEQSQQGQQQPISQDYLISAMSASIYNDIQACLQTYLKTAYKDGAYSVQKQLDLDKSEPENGAIENSVASSYSLVKAALVSLCAKLYMRTLAAPDDQKIIIKKEVGKAVQNMFRNVVTAESLRQKVSGASSELKKAGITKVAVKAEYRTAGDNHVCYKCEAYEGKIMSVDDIVKIIPQHPGCRCWFFIIRVQ